MDNPWIAKSVRILGIVVVLLSALVIGALWQTRYNLSQRLDKVTTDSESNVRMLYGEIDTKDQAQRLLIEPREDRAYLPELKISIPVKDVTDTLRYTHDDRGDIRLTSALVTDHEPHRMSCNDMVRIKQEDKPNVYSPRQPHFATVKLKDGRLLQIYTSTSEECKTAWVMVNPQTIAEKFKQAESY